MAKNFSVAWLSQSSRQESLTVLNTALLIPQDPTKAPNSPTNSCGYSSSSESEVGEDNEAELGPNRRVRTKFTSYQIAQLEKSFNKHKYLGANQRRKIAEKLHLSETQVKTWFQNRRMKLKRTVQDTRVEFYTQTLMAPRFLPPARRFSTMGSVDSSFLQPLIHFIHKEFLYHNTQDTDTSSILHCSQPVTTSYHL